MGWREQLEFSCIEAFVDVRREAGGVLQEIESRTPKDYPREKRLRRKWNTFVVKRHVSCFLCQVKKRFSL